MTSEQRPFAPRGVHGIPCSDVFLSNFRPTKDLKVTNCIYFNARSIKNKLHQLGVLLEERLPDIVFICESWLSDCIPNSLLCNVSMYNVVRKDRPDNSGRGGGVCALIKSPLKYTTVNIDFKFKELEIICFDIKSDLGKYRYILVYRPPGNDAACKSCTLLLIDCFSALCENFTGSVIIVGDLNLPHANWVTFKGPDFIHNQLLNFCCEHGLSMVTPAPTRDLNILDVVLTNDLQSIVDIGLCVTPPFDTSDHNTVEFLVLCKTDPPSNHEGLDFRRCDVRSVVDMLASVNWDSAFSVCLDINSYWDTFSNQINMAISSFTPRFAFTSNSRRKSLPKHLVKMRNKKLLLWRYSKNTPQFKTKYTKCAKLYRNATLSYVKSKEKSIVDKKDVGAFFKFVGNKLRGRYGISPLTSNDGKLCYSDGEKAQILASSFSNFNTVDNGVLPRSLSELKLVSESMGSIATCILWTS